MLTKSATFDWKKEHLKEASKYESWMHTTQEELVDHLNTHLDPEFLLEIGLPLFDLEVAFVRRFRLDEFADKILIRLTNLQTTPNAFEISPAKLPPAQTQTLKVTYSEIIHSCLND